MVSKKKQVCYGIIFSSLNVLILLVHSEKLSKIDRVKVLHFTLKTYINRVV